MLTLWLIRHARTLAPEGVCYGASDVAADPADTALAAQQAAAQLPQGIALYTSPLQRCTALAQQLRTLRPDLDRAQVQADLAEMNFGTWEGQRWDAIARADFDAWMSDFAHHRAGGGESTQALMQRVTRFLHHLQGARIRQAACVCHAGTIRALHHMALHGQQPLISASQWPAIDIPFGSCTPLGFASF